MTRNTNPTSTTDARRAALALALTVLALLGAVTASATVAAQTTQPTVRVGGGSVAADGTTTVGVVLDPAPDGLAGYYLEIAVRGDAARIESESYPDAFAMTSTPEVGDSGRTVALEAADLDGAVEAGASDVTLATVTFSGVSPGEVTLSVEPIQFDADDGSAFRPAAGSATLTVGGAAGTGGSSNAGGSAAGTGNGPASGAEGGTTTGAGSLPTALVFVAFGVLLTAGLLRRRRR